MHVWGSGGHEGWKHTGGGQRLSHGRRTGSPRRDWDGRGSMCDAGVGEFSILGRKVESWVGRINNGRLNNWL